MSALHTVTLSDNIEAGYRYFFDVTTTMMPKQNYKKNYKAEGITQV